MEVHAAGQGILMQRRKTTNNYDAANDQKADEEAEDSLGMQDLQVREWMSVKLKSNL